MFDAYVSNVCHHVSTLDHVGCGPVGPCGSGGPGVISEKLLIYDIKNN